MQPEETGELSWSEEKTMRPSESLLTKFKQIILFVQGRQLFKINDKKKLE